MTPRMHCQYVMPDMSYAGVDCTAGEAAKLLEATMQDNMTQRLLRQEREPLAQPTAAAPMMPAFMLYCQWPDGGVTLNVFCSADGWFHVWDIQVRRSKWLPVLKKGYATGPVPVNLQKLRAAIAWISAVDIRDVPANIYELA